MLTDEVSAVSTFSTNHSSQRAYRGLQSVIEEELFAVDEDPEEVFEDFAAGGGGIR